MRRRRTRPFTRASNPGPPESVLAEVMIALRGPVEALLTGALRRLARRHPGAFERLGGFQSATYRLAPRDLPVAFDLTPHPARGAVRVVLPDAPGAPVARIAAPLADLLGLFDGSLDADASFFSRTLQVEGDIGAVMALHNALEAAELNLADLAALPIGRAPLNALLERMLRAARRRAAPAGT